MTSSGSNPRIVALCGGVGGAKLALGLSHLLHEDLAVVVNTGDDFRHFGLLICPDLDTVTYTLADVVNQHTGWGRADETWRFMEAVGRLGGEGWFNLGDTDLATHAVRTAAVDSGVRLTSVTRDMTRQLGIRSMVLPASDEPVRTIVHTDEGPLPFQRYFVERRCEPVVVQVEYDGAEVARPTPEVVAALESTSLEAIVICPSNPFLSIDPMLAVPGFRELIARAGVPVIAVAPLVGGRSIKGPLGKMMKELGLRLEPQTIADHYRGVIDALVIDTEDQALAVNGARVHVAPTVMTDLDDKVALARVVLDLAAGMRRS